MNFPNVVIFCRSSKAYSIKNLTLSQKVSKYGDFSGRYSVRIQENTDQKKLHIWTLFTQRNAFLVSRMFLRLSIFL